MTDRALFNVFPKSGTGLIQQFRGIADHVTMFDERGDYRTPADYARRVMDCDQCTGHIPYSDELLKALKQNGYRIIFVFRNLRDVVCSLVYYVRMKGTELNVLTSGGYPLSEAKDPLLEAIEVVAGWWRLFEPWMLSADAVYSYRELRGAALLLGNEQDSFTFAHGNINEWQRQFKPRHIRAARENLPDVLRLYNFLGYYDDERISS
jgi:hypothetical protein